MLVPGRIRCTLLSSLLVAGCVANSSSREAGPSTGLAGIGRTLERRLSLPSGSVGLDTLRQPLDTLDPSDLSLYRTWTVVGNGYRVDTLRDVRRLDQRPDLWLTLAWPAVERLWDSTRKDDLARLPLMAWEMVPASLRVRSLWLNLAMEDGIDGYGQIFDADSLDRLHPRTR